MLYFIVLLYTVLLPSGVFKKCNVMLLISTILRKRCTQITYISKAIGRSNYTTRSSSNLAEKNNCTVECNLYVSCTTRRMDPRLVVILTNKMHILFYCITSPHLCNYSKFGRFTCEIVRARLFTAWMPFLSPNVIQELVIHRCGHCHK